MSLHMLDLHRLTLLREVKLHGSMSAAARELAYSHSAISQQLGLLEKETGVILLEKAGRGVKLTPAGEELVRNTEAILAAMERAEADLATSHQRPQGVVTIAAFTTISRSVMPAAVAELARNFPHLDVRLRREDPEFAVTQLLSRQVDAVVTDSFPGTPGAPSGGISTTVIGQDPVRGYLPPGRTFENFDQLRNLRWVLEPLASASSQWALRVCRELGIEPIVAHVSSDLLFHLRMVEQGLAAAFLPDMVVQEAGSNLIPSPWLPADQHPSIQYLVRSGAERSPALLAVRDAIVRAFQSRPSRK